MNLNIDAQTLEQCLKTITRFGENVYQNICDGSTNIVPWGGVDWLLLIVLTTLGISFCFMFIGIIWSVLRDY